MYALVFLLLAGSDHPHDVVTVQADVIELQHVYDCSTAKPTEKYSQWILWTWVPARQRFCVLDWAMTDRCPNSLIRRGARWTLFLHTGGAVIEVWAPVVRETWDSRDHELDARDEEEGGWVRPGVLDK